MSKKNIKAFDALQEAQKIAFAPFVFQTTVSLRNLGILDYIFESRQAVSIVDISNALTISQYGLGVLLEIAESAEIVSKDADDKYELTKIGYFLNCSNMTGVNINFTQDVCYKGLFHLEETIRSGNPEGLREFGNWNTIYEGLSKLPEQVQESWFAFDHFYSDEIFADALEIVFENAPKTIFDIGGNTGKFAIMCCQYNANVSVKIFDLAGQLEKALENIKHKGLENRISGQEIDWLSENTEIPKGADTIWMSQFLDCFSKEEIRKILRSSFDAMDSTTELIIIETFTDRQKIGNAKFILEATSLYFTAMANGNSKMYKATELIDLIEDAGLIIDKDIGLGVYHTLLVCRKK